MRPPMPPVKKEHDKRINDEIRASEVYVISEDGEPKGLLPIAQALDMAESLEIDLVEIGMKEGVPLTKLMDYGKYLFKQQKTLAHNKAHARKADLKTIQITYKMAEHDAEVRRNQAIRFSADKHPIKVTLRLRGRENQYVALADEKMTAFVTSLLDHYKLEGRIGKAGNTFTAMLTPKH